MVPAAHQTFVGAAILGVWSGMDHAVHRHRSVVRIRLRHGLPEEDCVGHRTSISPESGLQFFIHTDPIRAQE